MEDTRFDDIAKALGSQTSRRLTLSALLGGTLGTLGLADPEDAWSAKSGRCKKKCDECEKCKKGKCRNKNGEKRCKKGKCKPKDNGTLCSGGGTCQGGTCVNFCVGKNNCVAPARCERSGAECFCFVTAGSGQPFCGRNANSQVNCLGTGCAAGETCVDLTACNLPFQTACAVPCSDPL